MMLQLTQEQLILINDFLFSTGDEFSEYVERLLAIYNSDFRSDPLTQALIDTLKAQQKALDECDDQERVYIKCELRNNFNDILAQTKQLSGIDSDSVNKYKEWLESDD